MQDFNILLLIANLIGKVLYFEIFGVPFLVIWLIATSVYFSIKFAFPSIRLFKHSLGVAVKEEYYSDEDEGVLRPRQAFFTAISSTVGLGSIAGVAIAISIGGPGSLFWMLLAAILGSSTVFVEAIASIKYRQIDKQKGEINAGPFRYLKEGLKEIGLPQLGGILAVVYAVLAVIGMIGSGAIFQTNEAINILTDLKFVAAIPHAKLWLSIIATTTVAMIIIGGIDRTAKVMDKMVPIMTAIYLVAGLVILAVNFTKIPMAFVEIFKGAFGIKQVAGGLLGTIIIGVKRSCFSNEAGMGTTSIAHAAVKTKHPVQQASVAALSPLVVVFFCILTGLIITTTGVYQMENAGNGVILTKNAFASVAAWFPAVLIPVIILFAFSTIISYAFYSINAWVWLFGEKSKKIFYVIYLASIFSSAFLQLEQAITIADTFFLSLAIPNVLGLLLISNILYKDYREYMDILKRAKEIEAQK